MNRHDDTSGVPDHAHDHNHHHNSSDHHDHEHGTGPLARLRQFLHLEHHHHGSVDAELAMNSLGMRALLWSFGGLMLTALIQVVIVIYTGSAGLLADTIHNFGDASTAIPLAIAFWLARRAPTRRFTFGWGRAEDLAGLFIVLAILFSAAVAGYESVNRLIEGRVPTHIPWALAAGVIGFLGNEAVAQFRISVGRRIGSAALVADGYHARVDGFTSLAAVAGLLGVLVGVPIADPIAGLAITAMIVWIVVRNAAPAVLRRMLDGVEPDTVDTVEHAAAHVPGIRGVTGVQARWCGHRLLVNLTVDMSPTTTVTQANLAADSVRDQIRAHVPHTGRIHVEVTPAPSG